MQRDHRSRFVLSLFVAAVLTSAFRAGAAPPSVTEVSVSPPFFNPTASQSVTLSFRASATGTARVTILDRDRFPVRSLSASVPAPGLVAIKWDGRDDKGAVVPDEAWNVRIELAGSAFDPSLNFVPVEEDPQPRTYSRMDGILSYTLSRPSRVHIEAGQARLNPNTQRAEGPILKTIVNREPRVAGSIVERWNGFDESGTIRVSDLPNFVVSVLATSLPDASILTRGNRKQTFLAYARTRRPAEAVAAKKREAPTHHHEGLDAFEDRSPALRVEHAMTKSGDVRMTVRVDGPSAAHFLRQPGKMSVYVDEKRVLTQESAGNPLQITIPAERLRKGERRIAVNWGSDYGPTAATSFLIDIAARTTRSEVGR